MVVATLHLAVVSRLLLTVPGASEPSKLLLQYYVEPLLGVSSLSLPPSCELALGGASASSSPCLCRHRLLYCRERREEGRRQLGCLDDLVIQASLQRAAALKDCHAPPGPVIWPEEGCKSRDLFVVVARPVPKLPV